MPLQTRNGFRANKILALVKPSSGCNNKPALVNRKLNFENCESPVPQLDSDLESIYDGVVETVRFQNQLMNDKRNKLLLDNPLQENKENVGCYQFEPQDFKNPNSNYTALSTISVNQTDSERATLTTPCYNYDEACDLSNIRTEKGNFLLLKDIVDNSDRIENFQNQQTTLSTISVNQTDSERATLTTTPCYNYDEAYDISNIRTEKGNFLLLKDIIDNSDRIENFQNQQTTLSTISVNQTDSENTTLTTPCCNYDEENDLLNADREEKNLNEDKGEESETEKTPLKENNRRKSRKRTRDPSKWKKNIRKRKVARGESHLSDTGKLILGKSLKIPCKEGCFYKCTKLITQEMRQQIFNGYYNVNATQKRSFLLANTIRLQTKLSLKQSGNGKRQFVYKYYLPIIGDQGGNIEQVPVCKVMFLNTLCINQKPVYNVHKNKKSALIPGDEGRGAKTKSKISEGEKNFVRQHIQSFPAVESHYCRANTSRKYLQPDLNIEKMYNLYVTLCTEENMPPVKSSMYREIFTSEFNLDFLQPKSDRCDKCEVFRLAEKENRITDEVSSEFEDHVEKKERMRHERNQDREIVDEKTTVVCFDLQNVISLPRTEIGVAFYKRKMAIYNLTGHAIKKEKNRKRKKVYCSIWSESLCGRSGNDIASAVYKILTRVVSDFPETKNIITWSDSCVPQNRNSIIATAVAQFLVDNEQIESVTMKYSLPGHGAIQEIDNIHSQIEKALRFSEIWSILSLLRLLLKVNTKNPFNIIQMRSSDFIDFHSVSKNFNFSEVPFFKLAQMIFYQGRRNQLFYKTKHMENEMTGVDLDKKKRNAEINLPKSINDCPRSEKKPVISILKVKDICSLFNFMPQADKDYYKNTFKLKKENE